VKILVLPELCITGYTCGDLFLHGTLLGGAKDALKKIVKASGGLDMLCFVGLPLAMDGKLYNCAAAFCDGKLLGVVPKTFIPNYGEFYEKRYFTGAAGKNSYIKIDGFEPVLFGNELLFSCASMPELSVDAEICEIFGRRCPLVKARRRGSNDNSQPFRQRRVVAKDEYRRGLISGQSARLVMRLYIHGRRRRRVDDRRRIHRP
jgi:NAD+ synthase (glutamine-hydrolysing)